MWSVSPKASWMTTAPPLAGPGGSERIAGTSPSALAMLIASVISASVGSGAPAISVHSHRTGHRALRRHHRGDEGGHDHPLRPPRLPSRGRAVAGQGAEVLRTGQRLPAG